MITIGGLPLEGLPVSYRDPGAQGGRRHSGFHGGREYSLRHGDGTMVRYYVKRARSHDHGRQEALAAALYREAGVLAPVVTYRTDEGRVYSRMLEVHANVTDDGLASAREGFAVDAWLGNRDLQLGSNVMFDSRQQAVRIDCGGALEYRGRGRPKGTGGSSPFTLTVSEIETLRQPGMVGERIFGPRSGQPDAWEIRSAQRVSEVPDDRIRELVVDYGLPSGLGVVLVARKYDVIRHYNIADTTHPKENP